MKTARKELSRGFTLIELMIVVLMISLLASTAITAFSSYSTRSKAVEAVGGVAKIAAGQATYYARESAFISAGPTNIPPSSFPVPADFSSTAWKSLSFAYNDEILFGYEAEVISAEEVDCRAVGDLNGDGITSLYQITVRAGLNGTVDPTPLYVFDELE